MSLKRHTAYNLGGALTPAVLMLISVPLYFSLVGEARYGILAIVWLLTGSFGFFDFGLGRATAYALSSKSEAGREEREGIFWTAIIVNLVFGALGAAIMLALVVPLFTSIFNVPEELVAELLPVLPLLPLAVPLLTLEGVLTGALTGREKFLALNLRTIAGAIVSQLLPLAAVWMIAPTLTVAIEATLVARALNVSLFLVVALKAVPASLRPRPAGIEMARDLMSYGGWISLSGLLNPLIAALDRFLIASFLNPVAVAFYVVPYQLVTRGGLFSRALGNALFPKLTKLDEDKVRELTDKAIRANAAFMLILCSAGLIIMKPFLALWIDAEFSQSASRIGEQLVITVWLTAVSVIFLNLIEAQGRPQETVRILVLQTIPFIILAVIGVNALGILGVALARNVRSLLNLLLLARAGGYLGRTIRLIGIPVGILITLGFVVNFEPVTYGIRLSVAAAIWFVCVLWADRTFPEGRALVLGALRSRHA